MVAYASKPWYIQKQAETHYLKKDFNVCVRAEYERLTKPTFWGYDIQGIVSVTSSAQLRQQRRGKT